MPLTGPSRYMPSPSLNASIGWPTSGFAVTCAPTTGAPRESLTLPNRYAPASSTMSTSSTSCPVAIETWRERASA